MLIPSHRLTAGDQSLWAGLEAADRVHYECGQVAEKSVRAIEVIREFAAGGPCYGSVSWGKDSVVTAHLVHVAAPAIPLIHLRVTPSHSPYCDDVRDVFLRSHPAVAYHEIAVDYGDVYASGLSEDERDRETDRRFFAGFRQASARFGERYLTGIRGDESGARAIRVRKGLTVGRGCAPLGRWSAGDVFAYLAHHDLPVHPNYAMLGGGRWPRSQLRVAEIGDTHGRQRGRDQFEREYYGDVLRRLEASGR